MPELPEVETTINYLQKRIVGLRIKDVWFDAPKLIKTPRASIFKKEISGAKILSIRRKGKNILIDLDKNRVLLVHQKLTGHLLLGKWKLNKTVKAISPETIKEKVNAYIHLILVLSGGAMLGLSDLRKFAKVMLGKSDEIENSKDLKQIGIDPFDKKLTLDLFSRLISGRSGKIKQILMDQSLISGIGNIYSDEILWLAKIHPFRTANSLNRQELNKLYSGTKRILTEAVRLRGTSTSDYRDPAGKMGNYTFRLHVYRMKGKKCSRDKTMIVRKKIGGRSAHFCPRCQI